MLPTLLLAAALAAPPPDAWPGFRGDGSSTAAARLPLKWGPADNVAWRKSLPGYGQSSPVVRGGRAFVTAIDGSEKQTLLIAALDLDTGRSLWVRTFPSSLPGKNTPMTSRAAPTPCVDGDRLYAFFESGDILALSHAGELIWQRSLSREFGAFQNGHGLGGSPAQTVDAVLVLVDDKGPSYLIALDKRTGGTRWKQDRPSRSSWTSPTVAALGGTEAIIVSSAGALTAYDAGSGKPIAAVEGITGNTIPSAAVAGDRIVIGAGESRLKPDLAASARSNSCYRLDGGSLVPVWHGKKAISHHASPLVHVGHAYFTTKAGFVHCVDLETGEERYAERLGGVCWATPVGAGERIYFFGKDGVTTVLKAGPAYEELATNRLWATAPPAKEPPDARTSAVGNVVYGVAAVDGSILIRTGTELIRVREGGKP